MSYISTANHHTAYFPRFCHQHPWPSMQKPQKRWRSRQWFQTSGPNGWAGSGPNMSLTNLQSVLHISRSSNHQEEKDIKVTPNQSPKLFAFCFGWMNQKYAMDGHGIHNDMAVSDSKVMSPVSSKLWALSMVEWSFCRCAPRPYPCWCLWNWVTMFTTKDKDQAAHFRRGPMDMVYFFVSSSERLQFINYKAAKSNPFPSLPSFKICIRVKKMKIKKWAIPGYTFLSLPGITHHAARNCR